MTGCIYLITCLENNKKYVGQHCKPDPKKRWSNHKTAKDNYIFHNALRKYGIDRFTWEVLLICPVDKLTDMEGYYAEVFESYIWDTPGGYNAILCSESPRLGLKHSPETCEKMRKTNLSKKRSPETCEKIRQSRIGKKLSLETCEKMGKAKVGKKQSQEHIEKLRQIRTGKKHSSESCEKMRQARIGKKRSPETIEKMRQAQQLRRQRAALI